MTKPVIEDAFVRLVESLAPRNGTEAHTVKVLIVDPDPHRAPALAQALVTGGAEVTVAPSGSFALTMLEWNRHDVVDQPRAHRRHGWARAVRDPQGRSRHARGALRAGGRRRRGEPAWNGGRRSGSRAAARHDGQRHRSARGAAHARGPYAAVVPPEPPRPAPIAAAPVTKVTPPPPPAPAAVARAGATARRGSEPAPGAAAPERGRAAQAVRDRGGGQRPLDVEDDAGHRIGGLRRRAVSRSPGRPERDVPGIARSHGPGRAHPGDRCGGKSGRLILALGARQRADRVRCRPSRPCRVSQCRR